MIKNVFLMLCLAIACQAEIAFPGPCPFIVPMLNFDSERLSGKWYELAKYYTTDRAGGKCVATTFTPFDASRTRVKYEQIDSFSNTPFSIVGTATMDGQPYEARYSIAYPDSPKPSKYIILKTNYFSDAILYSCTNYYFFHYKYVWYLSTRVDFQNIANYLELEFYGIPRAFLIKTDQSNCPATH